MAVSKIIASILLFAIIALVLVAYGWSRSPRDDKARASIEELKREYAAQAARFAKDSAARQAELRELKEDIDRILDEKTPKQLPGFRYAEAEPSTEEMIAELRRRIEELEQEAEVRRVPRATNWTLPTAGVDGTVPFDDIASFSNTNNVAPTPGSGHNAEAVNWSADQASGPPDTLEAGDRPTAWASRDPDAGEEWLEVNFADWIEPYEIIVVETFNPGAVVRIEGLAGDRSYLIWEGDDPTSAAPGELRVPVTEGVLIDGVRVTLDTKKVGGWNEIDAVGAETGRGQIWGASSSASSTYAETYQPAGSAEDR